MSTNLENLASNVPSVLSNTVANTDDFYKLAFEFQQIMMIFESAIKQLETKLDILNKENNKNIVKYIGTIDNNYEDATAVTEKYVENAVDALLNNKQITTPTTVAISSPVLISHTQKPVSSLK